MQVVKLVGAVVGLIVAVLFAVFFPGSMVEQIIVVVAGAVFSYFGWNWRSQYSEIKSWVQSKTLIAVAIVFVPIAGYLAAIIFSIDLNAISVLGFSLQTIFEWLIQIGGGLFIIGAGHAKVKKEREYKIAA